MEVSEEWSQIGEASKLNKETDVLMGQDLEFCITQFCAVPVVRIKRSGFNAALVTSTELLKKENLN